MRHSPSHLFAIAGAKYLRAVDSDPSVSNQHEIGGLPAIGFRDFLGSPGKGETFKYDCLMAYLPDEAEPPVTQSTVVSWYDARWRKPARSPEYRLYYQDNAVTELMQPGDLVLVAGRKDGSLLLIITPGNSGVDRQLRYLFGLENVWENFSQAGLPDEEILFPLEILLKEIGLETDGDEKVEADLDLLLREFPDSFPTTSQISALARELAGGDGRDDPDETLMAWMHREEELFRAYEKHVVGKKLAAGFGEDGADVDEFVSFSLSVHNRRKSRVGHALENHLSAIFRSFGLAFEKGSAKRVTEKGSRPDFLFPGFGEYWDSAFPKDRLFLLGAKSTCKDRWRQVLAEGKKISRKHLVTLEAGITRGQTDEMQEKELQLVVPSPVWRTYDEDQREWLQSLRGFIEEVRTASRSRPSSR